LDHAGKSSLTVQYCEGHFVESYYPTIENTFSHEIVHKGQTFATEIIDTAGQVRRSLSLRASSAKICKATGQAD
jgi:Ras homolog enriched in brain